MSKLNFQVTFASGEDLEYPASELNTHSPHTRGWQAPRFCEYPQELGLSLAGAARLTQVQLLSHQSKIATRIELFVGEGRTYQNADWQRLGYLSLADNSLSDYQARELKSVYIDSKGAFLKLVIHKCYINTHNIFNQVGIVAINILGEYIGKPPMQPHPGSSALPSSSSNQGMGHGGMQGALPGKAKMDDLAFDMNLDPESAARIRHIVAAKERAVELEDYDAAKRLKEAEGQLTGLGMQLAQLEVSKRQAVQAEDYDRAKTLKEEIMGLRAQISDSLASVNASLGPDIGSFARADDRVIPQAQHYHQGGPHGMDGSDPRGMPNYEAVPPAHHASPAAAAGAPMSTHRSQGDVFDEDAPIPTMRGGMPPGQPHVDGQDGPPFDQQPPGMMDAGMHASPGMPPSQAMHASPGGVPAGPSPGHMMRQSRELPTLMNQRKREMGEMPGGEGGLGGVPEGQGDEEGGYFPAGQHPLEGVPNCENLPNPEPIRKAAIAEGVDLNELQDLLGEYVVACLYSKQWSLREAALQKARLQLAAMLESHAGQWSQIIVPVSQVIRLGVDDKIAQVLATGAQFTSDVCNSLASGSPDGLPSGSSLHKLLDPSVSTLVLKLGENQPRVRESAFDCLLAMANCPPIGADFVARYVMHKLPKKQTGNRIWRPLATRLSLLTQLVDSFGVPAQGHGSLSLDHCMNFIRENQATAHTFSEVRDAAKALTVALYRHVGRKVDSFLEGMLRVKQREEYEQAFQEATGEGPTDMQPSMQGGPQTTMQAHAHPNGGDGGVGRYSGHGENEDPPTSARGGRGRGRGRVAAAAQGPAQAPPQAPTPHAEDYGDAQHFEQEDQEMEAFKDRIMLELEEQAFSIEEAHNILTIHFGVTTDNGVKDRVLVEWCGEVGLQSSVAAMTPEERKAALREVAQWLFQ